MAFQYGRRTDENCLLLLEKMKECRIQNLDLYLQKQS